MFGTVQLKKKRKAPRFLAPLTNFRKIRSSLIFFSLSRSYGICEYYSVLWCFVLFFMRNSHTIDIIFPKKIIFQGVIKKDIIKSITPKYNFAREKDFLTLSLSSALCWPLFAMSMDVMGLFGSLHARPLG